MGRLGVLWELRSYFHDPSSGNRFADWTIWRTSQPAQPPGQGQRVKLDPAILELDLAEIPLSDDQPLSWNRRVLVRF